MIHEIVNLEEDRELSSAAGCSGANAAQSKAIPQRKELAEIRAKFLIIYVCTSSRILFPSVIMRN